VCIEDDVFWEFKTQFSMSVVIPGILLLEEDEEELVAEFPLRDLPKCHLLGIEDGERGMYMWLKRSGSM
jgi:hypothetical protein